MLSKTYYAHNYAGTISLGLVICGGKMAPLDTILAVYNVGTSKKTIYNGGQFS